MNNETSNNETKTDMNDGHAFDSSFEFRSFVIVSSFAIFVVEKFRYSIARSFIVLSTKLLISAPTNSTSASR